MKKRAKGERNKSSRGLSPVIATVLLITLVVVIAAIVFIWIRGMTEEAVTKFGDQDKPVNIQLVCDEVTFDASYDSTDGLYIRNPGTVPIFDMEVKMTGDGSHRTINLKDNENWPSVGLNQGGIFSDSAFSSQLDPDTTEIVLIPVLIGESDSGKKTYVCDEGQYGYPINV